MSTESSSETISRCSCLLLNSKLSTAPTLEKLLEIFSNGNKEQLEQLFSTLSKQAISASEVYPRFDSPTFTTEGEKILRSPRPFQQIEDFTPLPELSSPLTEEPINFAALEEDLIESVEADQTKQQKALTSLSHWIEEKRTKYLDEPVV